MASFLERNGYFADGDRENLLLMKKKKMDFDHLTSSVLMEQQKHRLASLHFRAKYNHLLFLPSIAITLVSGILAIFAQAELLADEALPDVNSEEIKQLAFFTNTTDERLYAEDYLDTVKTNEEREQISQSCVIAIAVLAAISVFWQSLMKQLDYSGRASLHDSAASALSKIFKLARMRSREQEMMQLNIFNDSKKKNGNLSSGKSTPRRNRSNASKRSVRNRGGEKDLEQVDEEEPPIQDDSSSAEEEEEIVEVSGARDTDTVGEDHFTLSKQFEQAVEGCTSSVPLKITASFDALAARINVSNNKIVSGLKQGARGHANVAWEKVYPALYYQLTITIIGSRLWPYVVPDSSWAVDKTIKDFKASSEDEDCVLEVLVNRAHEIDKKYNSLDPEKRTSDSFLLDETRLKRLDFEGQ